MNPRTIVSTIWGFYLLLSLAEPRRLSIRGSSLSSIFQSDGPVGTLPVQQLDQNEESPSVVFLYKEKCPQCVEHAEHFLQVARQVEALQFGEEANNSIVKFFSINCGEVKAEICQDMYIFPAVRFFPAVSDSTSKSPAPPHVALSTKYLHPFHILSRLDNNTNAHQLANLLTEWIQGLDAVLRHLLPSSPLSLAQQGLVRHWLMLVQATVPSIGDVVHEIVSNLSYMAKSYEYRIAFLDELSHGDDDDDIQHGPSATTTKTTTALDSCSTVHSLFHAMMVTADNEDTKALEVVDGAYQFIKYFVVNEQHPFCSLDPIVPAYEQACLLESSNNKDPSSSCPFAAGNTSSSIAEWWSTTIVVQTKLPPDCGAGQYYCWRRRRRQTVTVKRRRTNAPTTPLVAQASAMVLFILVSVGKFLSTRRQLPIVVCCLDTNGSRTTSTKVE